MTNSYRKILNETDVFRSFLVRNATYDGKLEFPMLHTSHLIPKKVITFSEALHSREYDAWVVFYEDDAKLMRVWNNPRKYLRILKRFRGVISPDFSLYRNMPLIMQGWMKYMSNALAHWWSDRGIEIIPNVRFSTPDSYEFAFDGIEHNSTVAIGTHGCMKRHEDKKYFMDGFHKMLEVLQPKNIIIYGTVPQEIAAAAKDAGAHIHAFPSQCAIAHKKKKVR